MCSAHCISIEFNHAYTGALHLMIVCALHNCIGFEIAHAYLVLCTLDVMCSAHQYIYICIYIYIYYRGCTAMFGILFGYFWPLNLPLSFNGLVLLPAFKLCPFTWVGGREILFKLEPKWQQVQI